MIKENLYSSPDNIYIGQKIRIAKSGQLHYQLNDEEYEILEVNNLKHTTDGSLYCDLKLMKTDGSGDPVDCDSFVSKFINYELEPSDHIQEDK